MVTRYSSVWGLALIISFGCVGN